MYSLSSDSKDNEYKIFTPSAWMKAFLPDSIQEKKKISLTPAETGQWLDSHNDMDDIISYWFVNGHRFYLLVVVSTYWSWYLLTGHSFKLYWSWFLLTGRGFYLLVVVSTYWSWYLLTGHSFKLYWSWFLLTGRGFYLLVVVSTYWSWFLLTGHGFYLLVMVSTYWSWFLLTGRGFYLLVMVSTYWSWFLLTGHGFYLLVMVMLLRTAAIAFLTPVCLLWWSVRCQSENIWSNTGMAP